MEDKKQIKVVRKRAGEKAEVILLLNTLESMQEEVGGYIKIADLGENIQLIMNEDSKESGLPDNVEISGHMIAGTILFANKEGQFSSSLSEKQIEAINNFIK